MNQQSDRHIYYQKGFKYQLTRDYHAVTRIRLSVIVETMFIRLDPEGNLTVKAGYAWDGPSGPTFDDHTNMRGSLAHDAKYQLMRLRLIGPECRKVADEELRADCLEDGMNRTRADLWEIGVEDFAASAADPKNAKPVFVAP